MMSKRVLITATLGVLTFVGGTAEGCPAEGGPTGVNSTKHTAPGHSRVDMTVRWDDKAPGCGRTQEYASVVYQFTIAGDHGRPGTEKTARGATGRSKSSWDRKGDLIAYAHQNVCGNLECDIIVDGKRVKHEKTTEVGDVYCVYYAGQQPA